MILLGYGVAGATYDFFLLDSLGRVWNGSSYVNFSSPDFASYRISATETGGPGRYVAEVPAGAASEAHAFELRARGASLATSFVVWTGEVSAVDEGESVGGQGIAAEIAQAATGPKSFQSDGQQVVAHPIPDLIKADQYLTAKRVNKKRGFWGQVSIARLNPPAANNDD